MGITTTIITVGTAVRTTVEATMAEATAVEGTAVAADMAGTEWFPKFRGHLDAARAASHGAAGRRALPFWMLIRLLHSPRSKVGS